jgi:hypothetical protein
MKKNRFAKIFLVSMLFASSVAKAGPVFFAPFKGNVAPVSMPMQVHPTKFQIFSVQTNDALQFLSNVSEDFNEAQEINMPTPDGGHKIFKIWSTPFLSTEAQAEFPIIKSFTGVEVGNNGVTLKLVFTHYGFSGQVYDGANTYIIQPYANANTGYYLTYYKRYEENTPVACAINSVESNLTGKRPVKINEVDEVLPEFSHNTVQRQLRLSMSSTTEWSKSITGVTLPSADSVYAKIVEIVNRLNGYHEREIAISYKLVSTKNVLFVQKSSDPFTCNDNMNCLLDENQQITNIRVGAHNYDIGHILCTAGGGLAALSSACNQTIKAMGASTLYTTTGLNVLMHEMGHQFSASHTFSANTAGCAGNGMPEGAYESGSGVTIMSYSGSCPPNNVPTLGDDYYHVNSLLQMGSYIQGLTCGTATPNIPILFINNLADTYHIPKNTPFELEGPQATVQGSQIPQTFYYNWEQYDIKFDLVEAAGSTETVGPNLRSHPPKLTTIQAYPPTDSIIRGTYNSVGYRLPNVGRDMHFKYTARGILNGKGAFNIIDSVVTIKVANSSGDFRITSQNNGDLTWAPGQSVTFTWTVGGTNSSPVNCGGVNIYLHYPDGSNTDFQLVSYAPNTGSYTYTVPNHYAKNAYIKIKGAGNIFFDVSKSKVNITGSNSAADINFANNIEIYPNPADDILHINVKDATTAKVAVEIHNILGQKVWSNTVNEVVTINTSSFARGSYIITVRDENSGKAISKKVVLK